MADLILKTDIIFRRNEIGREQSLIVKTKITCKENLHFLHIYLIKQERKEIHTVCGRRMVKNKQKALIIYASKLVFYLPQQKQQQRKTR